MKVHDKTIYRYSLVYVMYFLDERVFFHGYIFYIHDMLLLDITLRILLVTRGWKKRDKNKYLWVCIIPFSFKLQTKAFDIKVSRSIIFLWQLALISKDKTRKWITTTLIAHYSTNWFTLELDYPILLMQM